MKINGREINGPNQVTLVLPRETQDDIVIIAVAIPDMSEIDSYLVAPKPPAVQKAGSAVEYNFLDQGYVDQLTDYNIKKMAWIVVKSLEPSNIEWETVKLDAPSTWTNYTKEMQKAGFSEIELNRVCNACMEANALDERKLESARQAFLRGQAGK
jgi:hypothetical protein